MWHLNPDKIGEWFVYEEKNPLTFITPFFLLLFPLFLLGYYLLLNRERARIIYVIIFSFYFYYKSSGMFFLLLVASSIVDYYLALALDATRQDFNKRLLLTFSVLLNLSLLCYFKYLNFFGGMMSMISGKEFEPFDIFLPVGVSFFTFQSISYIIDVYRKDIQPLRNYIDYVFFISFFPQLVAGPIVRAKEFIGQIHQPSLTDTNSFNKAAFMILCGLFKKAVISDYISVNFVDRIFDTPALYSGVENLFAVYGYAIQIYCDFSGYTDIAIGIALLLGYTLPVNFNAPYLSSSITDFWRRWHISLSTWLREYLYIPLGGNRKGKFRQYLNLFLTMLLGGLWHGASLNFILWGALHGTALGVDKFLSEKKWLPSTNTTKVLGVLFTFHFVCFCWIFFRAADFATAWAMITRIVTEFHLELVLEVINGYRAPISLIVLGLLLHFFPSDLEEKVRFRFSNAPIPVKSIILAMMIFLLIQIRSSEVQPFIYFQF